MNLRKFNRQFSPAAVFIVTIFFIGCAQEMYQQTKFLMNTYVEIKIAGENKSKAKTATELVFKNMERLDKLLNCHDISSSIGQLNKTGKLSDDKIIAELIEKSIKFSKLTDGAFDVTVYPLMKLWNFAARKKPPERVQIEKLLSKVDYKQIEIAQEKILLRKNAQIDLGGIAKGFIVDTAIEILKAQRIKNALVNAGGDIRVIGEKVWKIGIQHPMKSNEIIGVIPLKNKAIATSGDYEQYFEYKGKRFHHILNPKTGYPADKSISVTIIADDATTADALSTAVFVLGLDKGISVLERLHLDYVIVDKNRRIYSSNRLKNYKLKL